jgi:uncharacterized membrane protein YdjX (TVP38/TMEM64 family)
VKDVPAAAEEPPLEITDSSDQPSDQPLGKWLVLGLLAITVVGLYWRFGGTLSLESLAEREMALRQFQAGSPWLAALLATALYIIMAGLSIPGAAAMTLVYAWYFGFWLGLVIVSIGSTGGATVAFLLTRYFFGDWVEKKFAERLGAVQNALHREGAFYLFTLRLLPAIPFFLINVLMGLTRIHVVTFWWVSQVGMLPGTIAYVYAGSRLPSLNAIATDGVGQVLTWQLLVAFAVVGTLPLAIKWLLKSWSWTPAARQRAKDR